MTPVEVWLPIIGRGTLARNDPEATKFQDDACDLTNTTYEKSSTAANTATSICGTDLDCEDDWELSSEIAWRVQNTFVSTPFDKPSLLQAFRQSRRALSAPARVREAVEREEAPADVYRGLWTAGPRPAPSAQIVTREQRNIMQHQKGNCKPCAFFWKATGCKDGSDCKFCHLCESSDRKRRKGQKKAEVRQTRAKRALREVNSPDASPTRAGDSARGSCWTLYEGTPCGWWVTADSADPAQCYGEASLPGSEHPWPAN